MLTEVKNTLPKIENLRLLGRALRTLHISCMESCSEEVDISFMEIWQCCQKSRFVFGFCILLTVIQKKVGIDEGSGNKS